MTNNILPLSVVRVGSGRHAVERDKIQGQSAECRSKIIPSLLHRQFCGWRSILSLAINFVVIVVLIATKRTKTNQRIKNFVFNLSLAINLSFILPLAIFLSFY